MKAVCFCLNHFLLSKFLSGARLSDILIVVTGNSETTVEKITLLIGNHPVHEIYFIYQIGMMIFRMKCVLLLEDTYQTCACVKEDLLFYFHNK